MNITLTGDLTVKQTAELLEAIAEALANNDLRVTYHDKGLGVITQQGETLQ